MLCAATGDACGFEELGDEAQALEGRKGGAGFESLAGSEQNHPASARSAP